MGADREKQLALQEALFTALEEAEGIPHCMALDVTIQVAAAVALLSNVSESDLSSQVVEQTGNMRSARQSLQSMMFNPGCDPAEA